MTFEIDTEKAGLYLQIERLKDIIKEKDEIIEDLEWECERLERREP